MIIFKVISVSFTTPTKDLPPPVSSDCIICFHSTDDLSEPLQWLRNHSQLPEPALKALNTFWEACNPNAPVEHLFHLSCIAEWASHQALCPNTSRPIGHVSTSLERMPDYVRELDILNPLHPWNPRIQNETVFTFFQHLDPFIAHINRAITHYNEEHPETPRPLIPQDSPAQVAKTVRKIWISKTLAFALLNASHVTTIVHDLLQLKPFIFYKDLADCLQSISPLPKYLEKFPDALSAHFDYFSTTPSSNTLHYSVVALILGIAGSSYYFSHQMASSPALYDATTHSLKNHIKGVFPPLGLGILSWKLQDAFSETFAPLLHQQATHIIQSAYTVFCSNAPCGQLEPPPLDIVRNTDLTELKPISENRLHTFITLLLLTAAMFYFLERFLLSSRRY